MGDNAISAQGTLVARAPAATPSTFTTIAELRSITPPSLMRNSIDMTAHNDTEETFVVGIKRKGELTLNIAYDPDGATHDEVTGLIKAWSDGSRDVYKITFPDTTQWLFSGYVTNFAPTAPTDEGLTADVTIRPTGTMSFA